MLAPLAACQTTRTTATDKAVCSIWGNVTYSASSDSQQTVDEIRALNAKRDAYCRGPK
jgi:hypothetical protein